MIPFSKFNTSFKFGNYVVIHLFNFHVRIPCFSSSHLSTFQVVFDSAMYKVKLGNIWEKGKEV